MVSSLNPGRGNGGKQNGKLAYDPADISFSSHEHGTPWHNQHPNISGLQFPQYNDIGRYESGGAQTRMMVTSDAVESKNAVSAVRAAEDLNQALNAGNHASHHRETDIIIEDANQQAPRNKTHPTSKMPAPVSLPEQVDEEVGGQQSPGRSIVFGRYRKSEHSPAAGH